MKQAPWTAIKKSVISTMADIQSHKINISMPNIKNKTIHIFRQYLNALGKGISFCLWQTTEPTHLNAFQFPYHYVRQVSRSQTVEQRNGQRMQTCQTFIRNEVKSNQTTVDHISRSLLSCFVKFTAVHVKTTHT